MLAHRKMESRGALQGASHDSQEALTKLATDKLVAEVKSYLFWHQAQLLNESANWRRF